MVCGLNISSKKLDVFVIFSLMLPWYLEQSLGSSMCSVSVYPVNELTQSRIPHIYFFILLVGLHQPIWK